MMKNSSIGLFSVLLALLTLGAGYQLREITHEDSTSETVEFHSFNRSLEQGFEDARTFHHARSLNSWASWIVKIETSSPDEYIGIANATNGNEVALNLLADYWFQKNRHHFLQALIERWHKVESQDLMPLAKALFVRWLELDQEECLAVLRQLDFSKNIDTLRDSFFKVLAERDIFRAIDLAKEWRFKAIDFSQEVTLKAARRAPARFAHALVSFLKNEGEKKLPGYSIGNTMPIIGTQWAKIDPQAAMLFAVSYRNLIGEDFGDMALFTWGENDLEAAGVWLENQSADIQKMYQNTFLRSWAHNDAAGAMEWSLDHLEGDSLRQAMFFVVDQLAERDVAASIDLMKTVPHSSEKLIALNELADSWLFQAGLKTAAERNAQAFFEWLEAEEDRLLVASMVMSGAGQWVKFDRSGMEDFLNEERNQNFPVDVFHAISRVRAEEDPVAAMGWADSYDETRRLSLGKQVFKQWLYDSIPGAAKWWHELPQSDPRREALRPMLSQFVETSETDSETMRLLSPVEIRRRERGE